MQFRSEVLAVVLEVLFNAVRVKLVRGQRVNPALLAALDGIKPGWRGHDDLLSLVRVTTINAVYRPDSDPPRAL